MKIAVLVSGGVDSSVALALLKEQGYDVTAFYLKIWLEDELTSLGECPWEADLSYVRAVCTQLDVPLKIVNLQTQYWDIVVSHTIEQIKMGNTPNPDILCNQFIKFGAFYDAIDSSYNYVATGHYAQIEHHHDNSTLVRSPDPIKDQTYFLCRLSDAQRARALFPIGHLHKEQVRTLARTYNLPTKDRKDSQGICFLGKFKFRDFVAHHLGTQSGSFVEAETGRTLGSHHGHWFYTIGQRQDIRLGNGPWYVTGKDPITNTVYISCNYHEIDTKRRTFTISDVQWHQSLTTAPEHAWVKVRHRAQPQQCTLELQPHTQLPTVTLAAKDQGIAPGQYAVFYDDAARVIGSGIIR